MIPALVGAAVSIGSILYSTSASRSDKRKAKKQLKKLAKDSGANYTELKSELDNMYSGQLRNLEDATSSIDYEGILGDIDKARATSVDRPVAPAVGLPDKSAFKDKVSSAVEGALGREASSKVLDTDDNLYSSAIKDWSSSSNQDYLTYATKLKQAQDWLDSRDTALRDVRKGKKDISTIISGLEDERRNTLLNMDIGNMQSQGDIAGQLAAYI